MSLRHELDRRHWPADLPDLTNIVSVFRAYGSGSHIAVVRGHALPDLTSADYQVTCDCGFSSPRVRAEVSTFKAAVDRVEGLADQHIEQTR
ncbi:hypothetical protein [Kitasatospora sp. NPDC086791]|uniref:hypothetical protein n=1 Tax=Kitasatospora sp. NPDC086791 TaxID=3155178 RepID=UPI003421A6E3